MIKIKVFLIMFEPCFNYLIGNIVCIRRVLLEKVSTLAARDVESAECDSRLVVKNYFVRVIYSYSNFVKIIITPN